ncbi:hypothetical protein B0H16DRAFT_1473653 [Mycena metata]|uniref:Uncharacterized protein n=1 Tax=Mycena metata TaxID=1033252 RepID=A0AAD7HJ59_9AGAR|nr:hypothetical protein B0H16DRAFT_1473653 [Mycena metata]
MARSGPTAAAPHAVRNPGRQTQVQLARPRGAKSKAVKASDDLRLVGLRRRRNLLNAAIDAEFLRRETTVAEIIALSGKKAPYVRALLASKSQFKPKRAPTLRNAVVHDRWLERPEGCTKKLQEYRKELAEDERLGLIDLSLMDSEERKRILKQLVDHRTLKRTGIRATTKAQQLDSVKTVISVQHVLDDLYERTGVRAIAIFSRGKADDPSVPHIVDSDEAGGFFMKSLGMSKVELLRKFENYNCSREDGSDERNSVREMRKDVGSTLLEGFSTVAGKKQLKMEYLHYDVSIREAKGVELAGWPADVKMADHVNWSAETLRRIRTALYSGAIHWVKMTKSQHDELIATHNAQREALGAGSLKPRKQRSDKGEARGPQAKKRATAAGKKGASHREEDDDDDSGEEDDDSDHDDTTSPPEHAAGVGASSAVTTPSTFTPALDPRLQILPEHLPTLGGNLGATGFEFDDETMEMLRDPAAWMPDERFMLPTDPESLAFAASFSLDTDPTAATLVSHAGSSFNATLPSSSISTSDPTLASSNASGGSSNPILASPNTNGSRSKRKRASENNDKSTPPPKKKRARGVENAPPSGEGGEPAKRPRKKRSDAGVLKGPRKAK